jgi:hypothetical protein
MIEVNSVRAMAAGLPQAEDRSTDARLAFEVAGKGFAWTFMRRVHPKKPRVPDLGVLAVRCAIERKELLCEAAPDRFFDDDHYRGYPAVLVRLAAVDPEELEGLLRDAAAIVAAAKPKRRRG